MVKRTKQIQVVFGGGSAVDVVLAVMGFAADGGPVAAGEQAAAVA
jgi:hypothetical protein